MVRNTAVNQNASWRAACGIALLSVATFCTSVGAAEITPTPAVKDAGKLKIASGLDYPPFEFQDESGHPTGLDIELAEGVAKLLGVNLDVIVTPFASQIPGLIAGRIKVAWATFTVNPERLKQVDFVAFLQAGTQAATTPDKAAQLKTQNDLCGRVIAVQTGSSGDFVADKLSADCESAKLPAIKKAIYPEVKDTTQAVLTGRADARLDDTTSIGYYEVTSKGKLIGVPGVYNVAPLAVAVAKGDKATAEMLQAALEKLVADGSYDTALKKYGMMSAKVGSIKIYTDPSQLSR